MIKNYLQAFKIMNIDFYQIFQLFSIAITLSLTMLLGGFTHPDFGGISFNDKGKRVKIIELDGFFFSNLTRKYFPTVLFISPYLYLVSFYWS